MAGLGGRPFCNHADMQAEGNVCTEDMVQMCHALGTGTGIDLAHERLGQRHRRQVAKHAAVAARRHAHRFTDYGLSQVGFQEVGVSAATISA